MVGLLLTFQQKDVFFFSYSDMIAHINIVFQSLCSTQEQFVVQILLIPFLLRPSWLPIQQSSRGVYWDILCSLFGYLRALAFEKWLSLSDCIHSISTLLWLKYDNVSPENDRLSWLEGKLNLTSHPSLCNLSCVLIRAWSRRVLGIPTTSPAATCWTNSAEWGGTCSTPASVMSEGRTQVSDCASFPHPLLCLVISYSCNHSQNWCQGENFNHWLKFLKDTLSRAKSVKFSLHVDEFPCFPSRPAPQRASSPDGQLPRLP